MAEDRTPRGYRPDPYGRGAPAAGQSNDPLAELARLIGQSDPFSPDPRESRSAPREQRAAPRDERPAPPAWLDPRSGRAPRAGQGDHGAAPAHDPDPHRGADAPASRGAAPDYGDPQQDYSDPRYAAPRQADPRYVEPPEVDPRYADPRYADPRYADPRYADPEPAYGDERDSYAPNALHDPHFPQDRPFPADGRGFDQTGLSDYDPDHLGAENDYATDEAPRRGRGGAEERPAPRRRLVAVLAVLGLALVGTAAALGYRAVFSGRPGPAPVIRADSTPNKVIPATQNGDSGSNKQIYDRLADRTQDERVVPREEQPVDIRDAARATAPQMIVPNVGPPATAAPAPSLAPPQSTAGFAPASANAAQEPRKVRTVTIRPDEGAEPPGRRETGPGAPTSIVPMLPAASLPARPAGAARAPDSGGPLSLRPDIAAPARTRTALAAAPRPALAPGSGYVVQVLAQSSEAEAQSSFRAMQARYPNQLGGLQPIIRRKEVGGAIKYGAQVGPYAGREEAVKLCADLKAAGGSCFVAKN